MDRDEQPHQDQATTLDDCSKRLDAVERAWPAVHDTDALNQAVSAYLVHAGREREAQIDALHRLIASYLGSRKQTSFSDEITQRLTALLRKLDNTV